jgi:hypothetical protein
MTWPEECGRITVPLDKIEFKLWWFKKKHIKILIFVILFNFFLLTRLCDFWYDAHRKANKYGKDKGLPS